MTALKIQAPVIVFTLATMRLFLKLSSKGIQEEPLGTMYSDLLKREF